jgi:hypothetical protein
MLLLLFLTFFLNCSDSRSAKHLASIQLVKPPKEKVIPVFEAGSKTLTANSDSFNFDEANKFVKYLNDFLISHVYLPKQLLTVLELQTELVLA